MRITGMPVHIETICAMCSSSTTGFSLALVLLPAGLQLGDALAQLDLAVAQLRRLVVVLAFWIASSFSRSTASSPRIASLRFSGASERCMRTRLAASSIRSIALSGRKRSVM